MASTIGLYIHIPYCIQKCPYCDFNSYGVEPESIPEKRYVSAVLAEFRHRIAEPEWRGREIGTVFIGGGTPSLLSGESIATLLDGVQRESAIAPDAEITLEANPGSLTEALRERKLAEFRSSGVNRLSFGAQAFDAEKLRFLGRVHAPEDTAAAVHAARGTGYTNINLDLICGVAGETLDGWDRDLRTALSLTPEHLSVYALTIEPGTPFGRQAKQGVFHQADEDAVAEMLTVTRTRLEENGFRQYEISNYSLPGHECRHNLGYWSGVDYLGLGAGAHSFVRSGSNSPDSTANGFGRRWSNVPGPEHYIKRALLSGDASQLNEDVTEEQAKIEYFFLGLRKREGIRISVYEKIFSERFHPRYKSTLDQLTASGLIESSDDRITLTRAGLLQADGIFAAFAERV